VRHSVVYRTAAVVWVLNILQGLSGRCHVIEGRSSKTIVGPQSPLLSLLHPSHEIGLFDHVYPSMMCCLDTGLKAMGLTDYWLRSPEL
jgi:hypothetical protein